MHGLLRREGQSSDTLRIYAGGRAETRAFGPGLVSITYELPDAARIPISGYDRGGVRDGALGEEGMVLALTIRRADGATATSPTIA